MTIEIVRIAATGQVVRPQDGLIAGIWKRDYAVAGGGIGVSRQWVAVDVDAGRIICGVHHAQAVVLVQKGLSIDHSGFEGVDSLGVAKSEWTAALVRVRFWEMDEVCTFGAP